MIQDILTPFFAVSLAEIGDKTQIAVMSMSAKSKKHLDVLLGASAALLLSTILATFFGNLLSEYIDKKFVVMISVFIFILFGILFLIQKEEGENGKFELKNPLISAFSLTFISEIGDKTQIASGLFATQFDWVLVFIGAGAGLLIVTFIGVYLGRIIAKKLDHKIINYLSGILFIIIGLWTLLSNSIY